MSKKHSQLSPIKRLAPYYKYLYNVKWTFITGVLAGVIYGISTGAGLPLATKYLFPILFNAEEVPESPVANLLEKTPSIFQPLVAPFVDAINNFFLYLQTLPQDRLLLTTCSFLPLIFMIRALGGYFNRYLISRAGLKVLEQLRSSVFQKLQLLSVNYFQKNNSGEILAKIQGSSDMLRKAMMSVINDIIIQPITFITAIAIIINEAINTDGALPALLGIVGIPIAIFPIKAFGRKIRKRSTSVQKANENLSSFILENAQSATEVRTYNLQESHLATFDEENQKVLKNNLKVQKYKKLIAPVIEVLAVLGLSGAIYLGVKQGMTLETFMAIATALYLSYEPVKKLGQLSAQLQAGMAALDRLELILEADDIIHEPTTPQSLPTNVRGDFNFQNVSFAYNSSETTLNKVNLKVNAGDIIALVGPSGSGKTTFMNLIPRLYDPSRGEISLDNVNLKELKKSDLRNTIGIVPQMPALFSLSIKENIRLGKPGATTQEVENAAKLAFAHDFINEFPNKYDTLVSEGGASLSGGQRQRIAIARAFLKNAPILLLDEATSALDHESETKITMALDTLMKGKTTFMIAHRESSLRSATRRILFSEGSLSEVPVTNN